MIQNGFFAEVIKTTRIEVDESTYGLPPHNGAYREYKVADYFCPDEWSNDGIFIPVKEGDPLWFDFRGNHDECAILCAVQRINPVTGEPADLEAGLSKDPVQNYLTMPRQRWLDGYAKDGKVYQFVVTKAGVGLAVNEFVLPKHMQDSHAIGFAFFAPKNPKPRPVYRSRGWHPGPYGVKSIIGKSSISDMKFGSKGTTVWNCTAGGQSAGGLQSANDMGDMLMGSCIDDDGIDSLYDGEVVAHALCASSIDEEVGEAPIGSDVESVETVDILAEQEANLNELDKASMGAGGRISQEIVSDDNTVDYYHEKRSALLTIYFALPEMFDAIMEKGKRQDATRKDKYKTSGHIGGVAVPLVTKDDVTQ